MKKLETIVLTLMLIAGSATASPTYQQKIDVYGYSVGGTVGWSHTYDHSADPVASVTLEIVADDVDGPIGENDGEQDEVWLMVGIDSHYLGLLNDMGSYTNWNYFPGPGNPDQSLTTTVFNLDPSWLNSGFSVEVRIEPDWGVEIETSTLTVHAIPAPGAILLGGIGVCLVGWLRRKRTL